MDFSRQELMEIFRSTLENTVNSSQLTIYEAYFVMKDYFDSLEEAFKVERRKTVESARQKLVEIQKPEVEDIPIERVEDI